MDNISYFERLVASAERIARHADYPGKEQAMELCLEDIEDLTLAGRITAEQRIVLREVLLGALSHAA
jgi:predicted DNA-binding protein